MTDQQRTTREAQLWELRQNDPAALLAIYRRVAGLHSLDAIPPNVAFSDMIRAIVVNEAKQK